MDDNQQQPSADNALEPKDGIFNPTQDEQKLPEDNTSPAAPADDVPGSSNIPVDHPETDSDLDSAEVYDEGVAGATDVNEQQQDSDDQPDTVHQKF